MELFGIHSIRNVYLTYLNSIPFGRLWGITYLSFIWASSLELMVDWYGLGCITLCICVDWLGALHYIVHMCWLIRCVGFSFIITKCARLSIDNNTNIFVCVWWSSKQLGILLKLMISRFYFIAFYNPHFIFT